MIICTLLTSVLQSCEEKGPPKLVIASAANVQFAMDEVISQFTEKTGIDCDVIISSSGKLTAQIIEGAPFDVFISADLEYPQKIADAQSGYQRSLGLCPWKTGVMEYA